MKTKDISIMKKSEKKTVKSNVQSELTVIEKKNGEVFVDAQTPRVRVKMYFRNGVQMLFPQEWDND